nr:retrovirus-related Pol polyprotein from transposon TNT 1-94 [Tanacetum cinerariifolium]
TPKPVSPNTTSYGKRRNRKACFVCKSLDHLIKDCDYYAKKIGQPTPRNHAHRANHKKYTPLTHQNPHKHMVHAAVLTQSKPVSITTVRSVSVAVSNIKVTRPRHAKPIVPKNNSPIRRHLTRSLSPNVNNSPPRVTAVKAPVVSAAQGNPKGGKISGKGKIRTGTLDFDDVYFVKELKFNIFNVLQMCDKKNNVLFTDTECLVLSSDFTLPDASQVLLRVPRENNMYNVNLKNIVPFGNLTCLFAKATIDESNLWHKRLGHINFKTMNKLGIKKEFSVPRTPQQNGIAERNNKTLIEAARTMLADLFLPIPFWAEAVNIACYVQNQVLVTKPHNKTPYELLHDRPPSIGFMRPLGCLVTILNTLDSLGKFDRKVDEGFLVSLTKAMNYQPVTAGNQPNSNVGFQDKFDAEKAKEEIDQQYVLFLVWSSGSTNPQNNDGDDAFDGKELDFDAKKLESKVNVSLSSSAQSRKQDDKTKKEAKGKKFEDCSDNNINEVNAAELEDITYSDDEDDEEPKRVHQALKDPSWIESMQEELLQFKMNKARLVAQGHTQEEGIDYEEVFSLVERIEAIRLFLAYASFMGFMVYQIDVKSAFLYGTIKEEVYVCQPLGFEDPDHPNKVYKVV